jgi:iron complex outermembrane receptor protein
LQVSAAFYAIKDRNRLVSDPDDVNYSVQLGEARTRGVELEAKGAVGDLNLLGSYAYLRLRADAWPWGGEADPDEQMEGFPEHSASAWAVYDVSRLGVLGLSVGGGVRYTGRIGDGTGDVFVPVVTLLDAMASFDEGPWRVALNVNNLTDKLYLATCLQRGDCWFGARRSVQASVAYRW